ncbi:hypothetical protein [Nocardia sp.]|uniref:hypothetical protein n=1 Tax=Nocardia sp. TaxID=1821 RepID=UPI00260BAAE7|nr:hypothetical protein [Nocardia sp.]
MTLFSHRAIAGGLAALALTSTLVAGAGAAGAEIPLEVAPVDTTTPAGSGSAGTSSAIGSAQLPLSALWTLSAAEQAAGLPDFSPLSAAATNATRDTPLGWLARNLLGPIVSAAGSGGCASTVCGNLPPA